MGISQGKDVWSGAYHGLVMANTKWYSLRCGVK
jgi:hypothetical protein